MLHKAEARGRLETAGRLRVVIVQVFRFAIVTGRADNDLTPSLRRALTALVIKPRASVFQPAPMPAWTSGTSASS